LHPAIPHLIELQRVDQQIAALRVELDSFPKRIRETDLKLGGARAEVAAAKEAHAQIVAERKKLEFEVAKAEDSQLNVMMNAEAIERRLKTAESRLKEAEQSVAAERKEMEAQG